MIRRTRASVALHSGARVRMVRSRIEGGGAMPNPRKKKKPKRVGQLSLARTGGVGGRRKGAGRKAAKGTRRNVPHRRRARLDGKNHPVHVTVRVRHGIGVPLLRTETV